MQTMASIMYISFLKNFLFINTLLNREECVTNYACNVANLIRKLLIEVSQEETCA